jgi:MFS family permease
MGYSWSCVLMRALDIAIVAPALPALQAAFGLAFIIGPILGGILLELFGWQSLFLVSLPIAVVVIALSLRFLPTTRPARRRAFDWPGMLAAALSAGAGLGESGMVFMPHLASKAAPKNWQPSSATRPRMRPR